MAKWKYTAKTVAASKARAKKATRPWLKVGATVWFVSWQGKPVRCEVERVSDLNDDEDGTPPYRWVYLRFTDPAMVNEPSRVTVVREHLVLPTIEFVWIEMANRERQKAAEHLAAAERWMEKAARGDTE